jgi:hypothetical protein
MAFLAIPGFNVALTAAISSGVGLFPIDPNAAATFATQLGSSYTYASISDGVNFEIVRVNSVSGADLVVTRAQDGTAASSFPAGSCIRYVWTVEGIAATAAGGSLVLIGTGAATATQTGPNAWTLDVPVPSITATLPIEVMGAYPNWELAYQGTYGACCCGSGSGGGSGGTITDITGTGLATITGGTGPTANVGVLPPNFIAGTNMTSITGTWPNITFNATGGGGGSGTVGIVIGSPKITISGSPAVSPVVNLNTNFSIGATYNGITFDAWGTITAINGSFLVATLISTTTPCVTLSASGDTTTGAHWTINLSDATISVKGIAKLAAATNAGSNTSGDATSIVTPAGVAAVLAAVLVPATTSVQGIAKLALPTAVGSNNSGNATDIVTPAGLNAALATLAAPISSAAYVGASSGSYTNTLASTITVPAIAAGVNVVITAAVSVTDSGSVSPPTWGLAVFAGAALAQGVQAIYTGTHFIRFVVAGPQSSTVYTLKTTALNGTTSVVAQEIDATVLPI